LQKRQRLNGEIPKTGCVTLDFLHEKAVEMIWPKIWLSLKEHHLFRCAELNFANRKVIPFLVCGP